MNITHHKNGDIKTLVDEAPYHPGYEDAGFKPAPQAKQWSDQELLKLASEMFHYTEYQKAIEFARIVRGEM